ISREPWIGALGLLVSPNRGLLIFSPIVLLVAAGIARSLGSADLRMGWLLSGGAILFVVYASYSVWWGGFTFGPRYLLDLLVPIAPAAACGVEAALSRRWTRWAASLLLAWSVVVA